MKTISYLYRVSLLFLVAFSGRTLADSWDKKNQEEVTLGKVATNAKMATPCGQQRRNTKAELKAIEDEIKKLDKGEGAGNI